MEFLSFIGIIACIAAVAGIVVSVVLFVSKTFDMERTISNLDERTGRMDNRRFEEKQEFREEFRKLEGLVFKHIESKADESRKTRFDLDALAGELKTVQGAIVELHEAHVELRKMTAQRFDCVDDNLNVTRQGVASALEDLDNRLNTLDARVSKKKTPATPTPTPVPTTDTPTE